MRSLSTTHHRHPELVSGSIVPPDRSVWEKRSGTFALPDKASARDEKWTLKQVQGDEHLADRSTGLDQ